jgi:hypothetical protein
MTTETLYEPDLDRIKALINTMYEAIWSLGKKGNFTPHETTVATGYAAVLFARETCIPAGDYREMLETIVHDTLEPENPEA